MTGLSKEEGGGRVVALTLHPFYCRPNGDAGHSRHRDSMSVSPAQFLRGAFI